MPEENTFNYDEWVKTQDEDVQKGLSSHFETTTTGLKTALDSERTTKKDLEKQLRDLAAKAEKGSEYEQKLTAQANELETERKRNNFNEAAHAAGVKNLRLAWAAAKDDQSCWKGDGSPDFDALKKIAPELFGSTTTQANAGAGTNNAGGGKATDMNAWIRQQMGG